MVLASVGMLPTSVGTLHTISEDLIGWNRQERSSTF
jgi:hypothetical protein